MREANITDLEHMNALSVKASIIPLEDKGPARVQQAHLRLQIRSNTTT